MRIKSDNSGEKRQKLYINTVEQYCEKTSNVNK